MLAPGLPGGLGRLFGELCAHAMDARGPAHPFGFVRERVESLLQGAVPPCTEFRLSPIGELAGFQRFENGA